MKLYHGTSKKHLFRILQEGITPRSINGISNWEEAPSHPSMVYLTTAYPFWFSVKASSEHEKIGVVIEIDTNKLDNSSFLPDEDFISQANSLCKKQDGPGVVVDVDEIRKNLFGYQPYWENSLEELGNCCYYGVIPPESITRYCVVDWNKRPDLECNYTDHSLNIEHYKFMGEFYRDVVKWFFGEKELLPASMFELGSEQEIDKVPEVMQGLYKMMKKKRDNRIKTSKNRNGIKVIIMKGNLECIKNKAV